MTRAPLPFNNMVKVMTSTDGAGEATPYKSSLVEMFGTLIDAGIIDSGQYEVRGEAHPIVYAYRKVGAHFVGRTSQLGGSDAATVANMLLAELPRTA